MEVFSMPLMTTITKIDDKEVHKLREKTERFSCNVNVDKCFGFD